MMKIVRVGLVGTIWIFTGGLALGQWPKNPSAPAKLDLAHSQYASGDFEGAAKSVIEVMKTYRSKPVVENAMQLADAIQEQMGCQPFPADWSLPQDVVDLRIGQTRREQEGRLAYSFVMAGQSVAQDTIRQLQLRHSDGTVILDKQSNLGEWSVEAENGGYKFVLEQPRTVEPIPAGLYFINIDTVNGKKVEGYVIVSNHVASQSPKILRPEPGHSSSESRPALEWADFRSPELSECEYRTIYLTIRRKGAWDAIWEKNFYQHPLPTSAEVSEADPNSVASLPVGPYLFGVRYNETRKFGPVKIRRVALSVVPFEVTQ